MTDATELDEAAVRARVEVATDGPWRAAEQTHGEWFGIQSEWHALGTAYHPADAEFIAHARTDIPLLLAALREARADANRENAQMLTVQDELNEALVSICEHKAAMTDMRRRKETAESALRDMEIERNMLRSTLAEVLAKAEAIRTLAHSWSGRHDLLTTGDSAAHDIEAALAGAGNGGREPGFNRYCAECKRWTDHEGPHHPWTAGGGPTAGERGERDRAVKSYADRLRSMGPDKVLLDRIEKVEQQYAEEGER